MNNKNIKKNFPFFDNNKEMIILDSAATSLKPKVVIEAINNYYLNYSVNPHSNEYKLSIDTKDIIEATRISASKLLNCDNHLEIIFTAGATTSFNQIAYGLSEFLEADDEIILTNCEHTSLLLPFFRLKKEKGIIIKFVDVGDDGLITIENLKKVITKKTKIIAFANMNNSLGTVNDVASLTKYIKNNKIENSKKWLFKEILVIIDGTQGAAHIKTDVKNWNIDFLALSGHKIFGPTGIGILWGKFKWLKLLQPLLLGGGMNGRVYENGEYTVIEPPYVFEAGTQNIAGIFGIKAAIEYLLKININVIYKHEKELKEYAIKQFNLKLKDKVTIYNEKKHQIGIILFNVNNVPAEEVGSFLGINNINVRTGTFCSKLIPTTIKCNSAIRVSLAIFNNKSDINNLIAAIVKGIKEGGDFLNGFF